MIGGPNVGWSLGFFDSRRDLMDQITLLGLISKLKFSDFLSVLALGVSGFSIAWNIYRDIILKAKIRVNIQISEIIHQGRRLGPFIDITGVNHGPGAITAEAAFIKLPLWDRLKGKKKFGFILPDYTNQLSGKLPKRLEVGEKVTVLFPYNREAFLVMKPACVGLKDSFGRLHWATDKSLKQATKEYLKDFPQREVVQGGEPD
jgi:hypothetical protein